MSMAGHSSSMTSWILITFLLLLTFWIHQSKARCHDYFDTDIWADHKLTHKVTLINATNAKDIIQCTLKKECNKINRDKEFKSCEILRQCHDMFPENVTCGESREEISLYNFLCLTAKALNYPEGCKFEPVCWLYSQITAPTTPPTSTSVTSTPTTPPTSTSTTSMPTTPPTSTSATATPTTATLPTSATATLPTSATATLPTSTQTILPTSAQTILPTSTQTILPTSAQTILPTSTQTILPTLAQTALPPPPPSTVLPSMTLSQTTTTVLQSTYGNASYKYRQETASPKPPKQRTDVTVIMLIISLFLNLVLPLAVYLRMRTKIQNETPRVVTLKLCNDAEAQPMRGAESSSESHSIRPSADRTRNGCPPDEPSPH